MADPISVYDMYTTDDDDDDEETAFDPEPVYLVDLRWWNEVRKWAFYDMGADSYTMTDSQFGPGEAFFLNFRTDSVYLGNDDHVYEVSFPGRGFALIREWVFKDALEWHCRSSLTRKDNGDDTFSLQIRLSRLRGTDFLVVKTCQKDNGVEAFKKACDIFYVESGLLRIWDFSGLLWKIKDSNKANEILMELRVYGLSSYVKQVLERKEEMRAEQSKIDDFHYSGSLDMDRATSCEDSLFQVTHPLFTNSRGGTRELGLTGLLNLGNTCFMNSAIQCLAHTLKLNDYFIGDIGNDLNFQNPLGKNGMLALQFGVLLKKLWAPGATTVSPIMFKATVATSSSQFSGYNQHDSQEFLTFLLDGLHEDLNRVKHKPYLNVKDMEGYPDEEAAELCWQNHLARNDSIIVDMFHGQCRSTLACLLCKKSSVTFDPFMYLSLPLPSTTMRTLTLTVLSTDGTTLPIPVNVTVPKDGKLKDLVQAVSKSCSLGEDETLLVAEISQNRLRRFLDKPSDSDSDSDSDSYSIDLIRDSDLLVAYRFLKASNESPMVVFRHLREELCCEEHSKQRFGIPLVARISDISAGSEIHKKFLELLNPFLLPDENSVDVSDDGQNTVSRDTGKTDAINADTFEGDRYRETGGNSLVENDFEFYLEGKKFRSMSKILSNAPIPKSCLINVAVYWSDKMLQLYDTSTLGLLPEIYDSKSSRTRPRESVSLYKCLEEHLKEEPLGPNDMWKCTMCKKHQLASKKLDLWRLPEILVIHLKRFSYNQGRWDKLEMYVDFPVDDFDLSSYTVQKGGQVSRHYKLYAVVNHSGAMGGGHYTAVVQHGCGRWFEFNDSKVSPVYVDQIKTPDAYVLFYRRISDV